MPLPHQLRQSFSLRCVGEYLHASKVLAPLASTLTSSKTINAFQTLHPLNLSYPYQDSLLDFQLNSNLEFSLDFFKLTFIQSPHLLVSGPSVWFSSTYKTFLTLRIELINSHNFSIEFP
jgi:hypothetical protein